MALRYQANEPAQRWRIALFLALLLSWLLLNWQLDLKSLWTDELFTAEWTHLSATELLQRTAADYHPPLYFLLVQAWTRLAGRSDFAVRWPSVVSGWLSIGLLYRLVRLLVGSTRSRMRCRGDNVCQKVAVFAAALWGLSPLLILYARMARYYALTAVLALTATALLLLALCKRHSRLWWFLYAGTTALGIYTFYLSALMALAHGGYVLLVQRSKFRSWLLASAGIVGSVAPWAGVIANQTVRTGGGAADMAFGLVGVGAKVAYVGYAFTLGETLLPWRPQAIIGSVAALALFAIGFRVWLSRDLAWPLLAFLLVPLAGIMAVITFLSPRTPFISVPARAFFTAPFWITILAGSVARLRLRWILALLLALGLGWTAATWNYFLARDYLNPIYATPSKEVVQFVASNLQDGDMIYSDWDSGFEYYYRPLELSNPLFTEPAAARRHILQAEAYRVWLIVLERDQSQRYFQASSDLRGWLATRARRIDVWGFLPLDYMYVQIKSTLLGRPVASHRVKVELYEL